MKQTFKFNPETDISEVDQFGFINITKSIQNGYVPGTNSSVQLEFDGCDDPSAIVGKPSDVFEAMRMQDAIISSLKSNSVSSDSSPDKGEK